MGYWRFFTAHNKTEKKNTSKIREGISGAYGDAVRREEDECGTQRDSNGDGSLLNDLCYY